MKVGILPAPGGGLRTMAGQLGRLTQHFTAYIAAGHTLSYFTWLPHDPDWIAEIVRPAKHPQPTNGTRRALLRPLTHPRAFIACNVLRAMSLSAALTGITARIVLGIPFVVSCGAKYEEIARLHGRPAWKWAALRRLAFWLASAVIVPNPVHAKDLQARFPSARIVHVPNWVDTKRFRPGPRPSGPPTVLYVGRLVIEKNLERLARVCRDSKWRLICVGDGPLRPSLSQLGAECPGSVPWENLPAWHAKAHVFCLPSFTEGHPKALLEAMASGLPCAVSTGIEGVVTPNLDAVTFSPEKGGPHFDMESTLRFLLDDWHCCDLLGANARRTAEAFDLFRVLPEEIRVVESCAS